MSIIASPNPLEMLLLFLLGGGFGLPSGIPPTEEAPLAAQVAPADCLFYTSWAGTGTPKADSPNQTEQLLAEREVQDFLVAGQKRMLDFVRLMAARQPGAEQTVKDVSKLLGLVQGKPGALYVSEFRFRTNGSPDVKGAGLLQLGDKTAEVEKLLKELQGRAPEGKVSVVKIGSRDFHRIQLDEQTPAVTWGTDGEYLVVGLGDGALQELLKRKGGASPDWLKNIRARLSVPRVSSVTYVNVSGLMKLALAETRSPETRRALLASGLDKLGSYASVSGLDEKGCVTRALLSVDGKGTGLLSWIDSKTLSADDLKPVGSDVLGAVVLKLDAAWALDLWLKMLDETEPREGMQFRQGMESFRRELGFDFREDILKSFGDTWRVFIQPTGPGALIHGWTLAVQVRDQKKLKQSQDAIVKQLKQQLEQGGPEVPTLTSKTVDGREIHTLDFAPLGSPFAPTWCLTDDEFFLAATPQTLESLLSGGSGENAGPAARRGAAGRQRCQNAGVHLHRYSRDCPNNSAEAAGTLAGAWPWGAGIRYLASAFVQDVPASLAAERVLGEPRGRRRRVAQSSNAAGREHGSGCSRGRGDGVAGDPGISAGGAAHARHESAQADSPRPAQLWPGEQGLSRRL